MQSRLELFSIQVGVLGGRAGGADTTPVVGAAKSAP